MQAANVLLENFARSDERIHFVDVASSLLDANGQPRDDVFRRDGVHLNAKGYVLWTAVLRPILFRDLLEGAVYPLPEQFIS